MAEPFPNPARRRSTIRLLWILTVAACLMLAFVSFRHYHRPVSRLSLTMPVKTVSDTVTSNPASSSASTIADPAPVDPDTLTRPVTEQQPQKPTVRHFSEHLSTDDSADFGFDTLWHIGTPDLPAELLTADTTDITVFYYLPNGTAVEYDLHGNRYRVFLPQRPNLPDSGH